MTSDSNKQSNSGDQAPLSLSWSDMSLVRIRPAEYARLMGFSRQTISQWIQKGIVTLGPDGKLDPCHATKEAIQKADPSKIRVKVFKQAMSEIIGVKDTEIKNLREQVQTLEDDLASKEEYYQHSKETLSRLCSLLVENMDQVKLLTDKDAYRCFIQLMAEEADNLAFDHLFGE